MSRLDDARALVRAHPVPEALRRLDDGLHYYDGASRWTREVTPEILARSLHYLVRIKQTAIADEQSVPLGSSKYKGLPHLPSSITWPAGHYFLAQLRLEELHPLDLYDAFPATGLLYLFFSPAGSIQVIHYDGPVDTLRVTPYPAKPPKDAKHDLSGFLRSAASIRFRPRAAFYLGSDAYDLREARKAIPRALRDEVEALLGAKVMAWDTDCRIFGRPFYWQGEDEHEGGFRDDGPVLLFHDEFGEGHIHFWIDADDRRRRDYGRCWLDYSGT
jgi:hypothetical protein